jgi:hypothetical protein
VVRLVPGPNPPETALAEVYEPPFDNPKAPVQGFSPRGMDVDRDGVVWAALASGHMASFDRRKCKGPLNGPTATGQHCPEGWTLYPEPLPQMKGVTDSGSAEASYYTWVDQFDTLGLGRNVPIDTGNASEGLLVLKDGKCCVPYPLGYYAKWLDGRIDDPKADEGPGRGPRSARAPRSTNGQRHHEQGRALPAPADPRRSSQTRRTRIWRHLQALLHSPASPRRPGSRTLREARNDGHRYRDLSRAPVTRAGPASWFPPRSSPRAIRAGCW